MTRTRLFWTLWMACGVVLTTVGLFTLRSADQLATDRNPFALQRSAYGKLLARLSENTIDRVWHIGVEQVAPHTHDEDCDHDHGAGEAHVHGENCDHGHDCDHDHGDTIAEEHDAEHEHTHPAVGDQPELTHSHYHDHDDAHYHGEEIVFAVHDHDHGEGSDHDGHDHGSHAAHEHTSHEGHNHAEGEECKWCDLGAAPSDSGEPVVQQAKNWLTHLSGMRYLRTNPKPMNAAHLATVKKDIEEMLLRSYRMDPTHYGVYNSYYLFLTTHDFGGTDATKKQAELISQYTIAHVAQETEDPEPWLTAAAATMNLYLMKTEGLRIDGEKVPVETLKEYRGKIAYCLGKFDELQKAAAESGVWDNLSFDRQKEIADAHRFAVRTFEPFDAMIARAEARESGTGAAEAEVAEILSGDGLEE